MKVKDFTESRNLNNLCENDTENLERNVNIDLFYDLRNACSDYINIIIDDNVFSSAEWNFMHYWYSQKGFTEEDWQYVEACGYERDQF